MIKKMNNESGAILLLTLLFILAFTSLGIASIYFAGQQNDMTEILKFSTQALWRADGAIERSRARLPGTELNDPASLVDPLPSYGNDDNGNPMTYAVNTTRISDFSWRADSISTVNGQKRAIVATIDSSGVFGLGHLNSNGDIDQFDNGDECNGLEGSTHVDCDKVEEGMELDFDEIFENADPVTSANADAYYNDSNYHDFSSSTASGLTLIEISSTDSINIQLDGSGFVMIDYSSYVNANSNKPDLNIEVAGFNGLLWVKGDSVGKVNTKFTGNGGYVGAIFIEGNGDTDFGGNAHLNHDGSGNPVTAAVFQDAVNNALAALMGTSNPPGDCTEENPFNCLCPPNCPGEPTVISWQEVTCADSPFGCN